MGAQGVGGADPEAVADAGPLIHLSEIGRLDLLRVFRTLHMPRLVVAEAIRHGAVSQTDLTCLGMTRRHGVDEARLTSFQRENELERLQAGEVACLLLCKRLDVSILLCDDLAGRDAAVRMNVRPVGSLGVVARAYRRGLATRNEAEKAIADLYDVSTLFVTRAIVDIVLADLHRQTPA